MNRPAERLKTDIRKRLDDLQGVREEVRLKLHLADMDAKTQWRAVEEQLETARRDIERTVTTATRKALDEAIAELERFRADLH